MNNESNNKKESILKTLAIVGFIGIIILISWLSVQLVHVMPSAFSSLASLAEGLDQQSIKNADDNEPASFTVTSEATLVNNGESMKLFWDTARVQGTYTFAYSCTGGVSIDILDVNEGLQNIACDTNYNIGNTDSINIQIESEKKRFENVNYTVSFLATNDTKPRATGKSSFTVINSDIQDVLASDTEDSTPAEETETTVGDSGAETGVETPVDSTPTYEQEFVYTIPTSDPNGRTDLFTKFLSTGNITANAYFSGTIEKNDSGALQFEVKNFGTKTSEDWTYSMTLPGGGVYTSTEQAGLKPNERAVITIGFPTTDISRYAFVVKVEESTDKNILNNRFTQVVNFVN